jgi:hypothetical protein
MKISLYVTGTVVLAFSLIQTFGAQVIASAGFICGTILVCAAAILGAIERQR